MGVDLLSRGEKIVLFVIILFSLLSYSSHAYSIDTPNATVHQHISKEARDVWIGIPNEMLSHSDNDISSDLDSFIGNYDEGDDIITGSGEEDIPIIQTLKHFWESDTHQDGEYNLGLDFFGQQDSSYRTAMTYWNEKIIPCYTGEGMGCSRSIKVYQDKSYYYLGRIAHLLEDATVPAHTHLDNHAPGYGDDSLEEYTAENYVDYSGSESEGEQYNYESFPNLEGFDWNEVQPDDLTQNQINLFKLFWYTAQKTQYYSSDDESGNSFYINLNNDQENFQTSLWQGDGAILEVLLQRHWKAVMKVQEQ